ncbi:type II secretion system protein J [Variovorax sp. N23]|uniref:PulJ/GspJ family protein n=1 Tax=Variovorax sp. N23 TaxID=2980555 RepID=UPI0021C8F986|nr:prepilin-type N-terminal cleavage/methylation domain-containing protein [Variovorax sp. N23]MCU4120970.1 prepilin-type N-terminal cleavage/methylation domain-containing protein [Variovorax sp. N23]
MRLRTHRGFTLIELMVAIAAMALLALMSWRGLEGMTRAQTVTQARGDAVLTLQTTLSQWATDLDATIALTQLQPIDWNGSVLRITRRSGDSTRPTVVVVAWALRTDAATGTQWRRWQSPGVTTRAEWQQAWDRASAWAQDGGSVAGGAELTLMPLESWQLSYFRNGVWTAAVGAEGMANAIPDGIRLVLNLPPGTGLTGVLTRDWVRPTAAVPKT